MNRLAPAAWTLRPGRGTTQKESEQVIYTAISDAATPDERELERLTGYHDDLLARLPHMGKPVAAIAKGIIANLSVRIRHIRRRIDDRQLTAGTTP